MAQPTPSDVHSDAILTSISVAYEQSNDAFVASKVFPVIPVDKQSDKYFVYDKADWFRDEAAKRAPGTESVGSGYNLSQDSYNADVWAFHKDVSDQERANTDEPLDADADAARFVANRLLMRRERQWASDYFTTGVWATDDTSATNWDTYASSTPLEDVEEAKTVILSTTGFEANTLVLGYNVFTALKHHPDIREIIKYTSSEVVTAQLLARLFEIDRVLVARAIVNSAAEGATPAYSFVHGKSALLCHVATSPGRRVPSAGYHFGWRGVSDGLGETIGTTSFRMPELRVDRIESQMAWDNKVVAPDLGFFFSGIVS